MSQSEIRQTHCFSFDSAKKANRVCHQTQLKFTPEPGVIFVDGQSIYIDKSANEFEKIRRYLEEVVSNPNFQPAKRASFKKTLLASAVVASSALIPPFSALANPNDFVGEWNTNYGTLQITPHPNNDQLLVGSYGTRRGVYRRIVGSVSGNVFSGMWFRSASNDLNDLSPLERETHGLFVFVLDNNAGFQGRWVYRDVTSDDTSTFSTGGEWNGSRTGVPESNNFDTDSPLNVSFSTNYGDVQLTRQNGLAVYQGLYRYGQLQLLKVGEHYGGLWFHNNTSRYGSLSLASSAHAHFGGRWDDILGGNRGGQWDFNHITPTMPLTSHSPYADLMDHAIWLKGEAHTHVANYTWNTTGRAPDTAGRGGRLANGELMQVLHEQHFAFAGLTGHECFPESNSDNGTYSGYSNRTAMPIGNSEIPNNFTPFAVCENQVAGTRPNWSQAQAPSNRNLQNWREVSFGNCHRIFLNTEQDAGFILGHPDYYSTEVSNANLEEAVSGGQRVLGVEVYNRYGEDRFEGDIEGLGSRVRNPYGFEFWDRTLNNNQYDYPIWAFAGDDSFLHMHNDPNIPLSVKYRNNKGMLLAALPNNFYDMTLPDRQQSVINTLCTGRFYASAGHAIRFSNIYYDTANHTLNVTSEREVDWYVYSNDQMLRLGTTADGTTVIDDAATSFTQTSFSAQIQTQQTGYTRLEARISHQTAVLNERTPVTHLNVPCYLIEVEGDVSHLATEGELLFIMSASDGAIVGPPGAIVDSVYSSDMNQTRIYVLRADRGRTDGRINPNRFEDQIHSGMSVKMVQRAWLQPAWANPSDAFNEVVQTLNTIRSI